MNNIGKQFKTTLYTLQSLSTDKEKLCPFRTPRMSHKLHIINYTVYKSANPVILVGEIFIYLIICEDMTFFAGILSNFSCNNYFEYLNIHWEDISVITSTIV